MLLMIGFVLIVIFYYLSMPKTVALEDDGLFILSAFFNGVSHPPGYPLHSLLSYLATLIPFDTVAVRVHLVSAIFGAATCILAAKISYFIVRNKLVTVNTAILVAVGQGFWSQSIISEVYTLNAFLVLLFIYLVLQLNEILKNGKDPESYKTINKTILYLSVCLGVGLSNHWPLFVLGIATCIVILRPITRGELLENIQWKNIFIGVLIGLTPILWLIINSNLEPFISFIGKLSNISEIYDFLSRKYYQNTIDTSTSVSIIDRVYFIGHIIKLVLFEHHFIGMLFVTGGLYGFYRSNIDSNVKIIFLTIILAPLLLPLLLNYDYTHKFRVLSKPYYVVPYVFSSIFLSLGIYYFCEKFRCSRKIYISIVVLVIASGMFFNKFENYRHNYDWSKDYAMAILDKLEKNSTIFVDADTETTSLAYLRYVTGYRPDITIIHRQGLVFATRLFDPRYISAKERNQEIIDFTIMSENPVYFTYQQSGLGLENHWLYYKYNKNIEHNLQVQMDIRQHSKFLLRVFANKKDLDDAWTHAENNGLKRAALVGLLSIIKNETDNNKKAALVSLVESSLDDITILLPTIFYSQQLGISELFGGIKKLSVIADELFTKETDKVTRSEYYNFKGQSNLQQQQYVKAVSYFKKSLSEWSNSKNIASGELKKICSDKSINIRGLACDDI